MVERRRVVHPEGGDSMTKQADALDSDINKIMNRYVTTGVLPPLNGRQATYGDFQDSADFYTQMNRVTHGRSEFERLPAHIRDYCKNDLGVFLDLVSNPERRKELEKLGLTEAQVPENVAPVAPVAPVEEPVEPTS